MIYLQGKDTLSDNKNFSASEVGRSLQSLPLTFIDIGARGGAHDLVEPIAKNTAVLGFEADEDECKRLMQNPEVYESWAKFELEPIALADKKGTAELVLVSANTNHSLLYPNEAFTKRYNMTKWQVVGKCPLETDTLDAVLFRDGMKDFPWGEFMKIDTQGTEFEILKGANRTLTERTVAVVAEVAFCELYKDQKLFSDVEALMRQHGFSFYGFTSLHTRSKKLLNKKENATRERLIYTDAIFFKDPLPGGYSKPLSARGNYTLFTIALLLGFYDYAYELAQQTWLVDADQAEKDRIEALIKSISSVSADKTKGELLQLVDSVNTHPEWANVAVGGFVDRRRGLCDYDDVLNVSPLPKTL